MDQRLVPDMAEALGAAFDWWRDAGVDCTFHDQPTRWIAPGRPEDQPTAEALTEEAVIRAETAAPASPAAAPPDHASWPQDLAGFAAWWLTEPWLDWGRVSDRVAPRGSKSPQLMVVVPEPEREDGDRLLSGPDGRLLDGILSAMRLDPEQVYVASVLPRHTPAADWVEISARGMGDLLGHHVRLVDPERLIFFGGNILSLAGNDLPQGPAVLRKFNHEGASIPLLAARSLPALRQRPSWKAELWRAWLDWTGKGPPSGTG